MRIQESFAANETKRYNVVGHYFRVKSLSGVLSGSISAAFWRHGQRLDVDLDGSDAGDYAGPFPLDAPFDYFEVTSAEAQTVDLQVMRGPVGSNRVVGEVSVVSGELARTRANRTFIMGAACNAVAGQFSHVQLWNPSSIRRLVIDELVIVNNTSAGALSLRQFSAQLSTAGPTGIPKFFYAGAVASGGILRTENNAGALGTAIGSYFPGAANSSYRVPLVGPIVINPNFGLGIVSIAVNELIRANFQWWEEDI